MPHEADSDVAIGFSRYVLVLYESPRCASGVKMHSDYRCLLHPTREARPIFAIFAEGCHLAGECQYLGSTFIVRLDQRHDFNLSHSKHSGEVNFDRDASAFYEGNPNSVH